MISIYLLPDFEYAAMSIRNQLGRIKKSRKRIIIMKLFLIFA